MSEDDGDSRGFFRRHWKGSLAVVGFVVVSVLLVLLASSGVIPDLGFLFSPFLLTVYLLSAFVIAISAFIYSRVGGGGAFSFGAGTSVDKQLTKYEAHELAKWILFEENPPIKWGETHDRDVEKRGNEEFSRIFTWEFDVRNSHDTVTFIMDLEQEVEFNPEWTENLTEDKMEKLEEVKRDIINWGYVKKSKADNYAEEVERKKDQMAQRVRQMETIRHFDEGEVSKEVQRDITGIKNSGEVEAEQGE